MPNKIKFYYLELQNYPSLNFKCLRSLKLGGVIQLVEKFDLKYYNSCSFNF